MTWALGVGYGALPAAPCSVRTFEPSTILLLRPIPEKQVGSGFGPQDASSLLYTEFLKIFRAFLKY
jgi:hypothetical protein